MVYYWVNQCRRHVKEKLKNNIFQAEIVSLLPLPDYLLVYAKLFESPNEFYFEMKVKRYLERRYDLFNGKKMRVAIPEKQMALVS